MMTPKTVNDQLLVELDERIADPKSVWGIPGLDALTRGAGR